MSPQGELRDEMSASSDFIVVQYPLRSECFCHCTIVSVDENTLHVQSGVTILTDGDFSEGETLFVTSAVCFYD